MRNPARFVVFLFALGALGLLLAGVRPKAEETESSEPPPVSEDELELYIKVYSAMQDDHDLSIENAIRPYQTSLDNFRQLERRIQNQPRLVERVRQALLEHAKHNSLFAEALGTPTVGRTPAAQEPKQGKKR